MKKIFKKIKIPFGWLPGHWGLRGKIREEAKIFYEIDDPKERDYALLELKYRDNDDPEKEKKKKIEILNLQKKYGDIDDFEYEIKLAEINNLDPEKMEEEKNEILFKYKKIDELEYERNKANIRKEPWIKIISEFITEINGKPKLGFKFEWNEYFIKYLEENGYSGFSEEAIVDKWFTDIVKSNIFSEFEEDVIQEYEMRKKRENSFVRKIKKNVDEQGRSEYS